MMIDLGSNDDTGSYMECRECGEVYDAADDVESAKHQKCGVLPMSRQEAHRLNRSGRAIDRRPTVEIPALSMADLIAIDSEGCYAGSRR